MKNTEEFLKKEKERFEKLYSTKHKKGFPTREIFSNCFVGKIKQQNFECYYCETSIFDIQKLIGEGKLLTRKTGYGLRGPVLEIDRMCNSLGYNENNCVLSCYYCNNDKSYTLDSETYKRFFGEGRKKYFEYLKQH